MKSLIAFCPSKYAMLLVHILPRATNNKKWLWCKSFILENTMSYDMLVVAAGSVVRQPDPNQGGMPLATLDGALKIRNVWLANMKKAVMATNTKERERLMTIEAGLAYKKIYLGFGKFNQ